MSKPTIRITGYLRSLLNARAIIFGITILQLIVIQVWVGRWYHKFADGPIDTYPNSLLTIPLLLILASSLLLLGRPWSDLLALLISGWVIYFLGYTALKAAALSHDVPLFSLAATRIWFTQKYAGQPQEFIQLALALVIVCYTAIVLRSRRILIGESSEPAVYSAD